jgi:NAD(P)-dependent dehydrogenase (short-subunit alcohol dehydrogenase family)
VASIEDLLGPIDVLINNAGVAVSKGVLEQTEADWDKVLDTNLKGAFFVAQTVAKRMVARDARAAWAATSSTSPRCWRSTSSANSLPTGRPKAACGS